MLLAALAGGCRPAATSDPAGEEAAPAKTRPGKSVRTSAAQGPAAENGEASLQQGKTADFAGSKTCRDCHADFYRLWSTSHHGLAMQPYTAEFAQANLSPQQSDVSIGNRKYRAEVTGGQGSVRESSPQGEKKYPIAHVMGGKNVYYFLAPLERGRLQVLPVAYDIHKKTWYDTAASGVRHFPDRRDEALDWTYRMFTFNTTCFNCHVSQLATNYDLAADTYHTTWAEPGISCESCHGPGGEHTRAMVEGVKGHTSQEIKILRTKEFTAEQTNDMCATCHAKMVPLSLSFRPGEKFFDHYDLITLEHADYYPDGRDLGENYTHTSWLMSPCAKSGKLDCNHCHTPSGRMRFEQPMSNRACLPCHEKEVRQAAEHSRHPPGSTGTECIPCHMPMTQFAAMNRSDHSMRPPTPAATLAFKSPNACNLCHADQDAAWADKWVRQWYKRDYQAEVLRRAALIDAARRQQWKRLPEMLADLQKQDGDAVHKASLVRLLGASDDPRQWPVILELLRDPSPLVRSSAAAALRGRLTPEAIQSLLKATADPSRLVRIRAARALAALPPNQVSSPPDRANLHKAVDEFMTAMKARADDWASYTNLGDFYMDGGDLAAAVDCFETAYRLEPRSIVPMVHAALAYNSLRRNDKAEESLRRALKFDPDNAAANFNLGLLLGEQGRLPEAEAALRKALKADPQMAAAAYNLGVILGEQKLGEAITWCQQAHQLRPHDAKYAHTLAFFYWKNQKTAEAVALLRQVIEREPSYWDAYLLLAAIQEQAGNRAAAAAVYRDVLRQDELPPVLRRKLEARLRALESPKD